MVPTKSENFDAMSSIPGEHALPLKEHASNFPNSPCFEFMKKLIFHFFSFLRHFFFFFSNEKLSIFLFFEFTFLSILRINSFPYFSKFKYVHKKWKPFQNKGTKYVFDRFIYIYWNIIILYECPNS